VQTAGSSIESNPNTCNASTHNQHIELLGTKLIQIELSVKAHGESLNQGD
jgi:hypothetical protein